MTHIQIIRPARLHPTPAFLSPASKTNGIVFLGGQVALDEHGKMVGLTDVRQQTVQALANFATVLAAGGGGIRDVVSVTAYLRHVEDYKVFNEEYERFFEGWNPPRATIACELMRPEFLVEIQGIAVLRGSTRTHSAGQYKGVGR